MNKTYRIVTENITTLSAQDYFRVQNFATKTTVTDLDEAQLWLGKVFPVTDGWFIYRGGSHVALHRTTAEGGMNDRILMIEEREVEPTFAFRVIDTTGQLLTVATGLSENDAHDRLTAYARAHKLALHVHPGRWEGTALSTAYPKGGDSWRDAEAAVVVERLMTPEPVAPTPERDRSTLGSFASLKSAVAVARSEARKEAVKLGKPNTRVVHGRTVREPAMPFTRSRGTFLCTVDAKGQCAPCIAAEGPIWDGTKKSVVALVAEVQASYPNVTEVYIEGGFDISDLFNFDDYVPHASTWEVSVWTREGGWQF